MLKKWIQLIKSILKAIFQFRKAGKDEEKESEENQQEILLNEYNKIDEEHKVPENQSIDEIADKLNDRF